MNKIKIAQNIYPDVEKVMLYDDESKELVAFPNTSQDSVSEDTLLDGVTAHDAKGNKIVGNYTPKGGSATSSLSVVRNRIVSVCRSETSLTVKPEKS